MKTTFTLIFVFLLLNLNYSQDTFSICAVDTVTGELASAGASCIGAPQLPQGCSILSDVIPGTGVIHTQAYYTSGNQNYAHSLMIQGVPPEQMIDSLVAHDVGNNPTIRQYGIVDFYTGVPRTAAYTGVNCDDYKNHIIGPNYTIQGNILLGQQILDSMEVRFLATEGELACKLMAALQGAKVIGADTRCLDDGVSSLSSFLRVAKPDDPANNLYLDLNVASTPEGIDPIDSMQVLVDNWGGCLTSEIGEKEPMANIRIYPNPAKDNIILHIRGLNGRPAIMSVFNSVGKPVTDVYLNHDQDFRFAGNPAPGLYFYLLTIDRQPVTKGKFIIK